MFHCDCGRDMKTPGRCPYCIVKAERDEAYAVLQELVESQKGFVFAESGDREAIVMRPNRAWEAARELLAKRNK